MRAAKARDLPGLRAAAVIHISTAPVVHSRAALTSKFTRIIHKIVHRALSWLVKGSR